MKSTQDYKSTVASSGYVFAEEARRYAFEDVVAPGCTINRGTSLAGRAPGGDAEAGVEEVRREISRHLFPTTLRRQAPVIDISLPLAGHYFGLPDGVGFDAYLGVGQRLIDEAHPRIHAMIEQLVQRHLLLRRETATNDYMVAAPDSAIATPQELARLVAGEAGRSFPSMAPFRAYFSSSGAEAIEAGMKLACIDAHARLIRRYGWEGEARLMEALEIGPNRDVDHPEDRLPLYEDYPFFFVTARGAFHGRTFGALSLTSVRPVNKRGFPAAARISRIDYNGSPGELEALIDPRDLIEIIEAPGGVKGVLARGAIPVDLIAGFVVEPFQGEAGYRLPDREWLRGVVGICRRHGISVLADEIQTFARTGETFASTHFGVEPDIVAVSKSAVIGMTLASERYAEATKLGWHSTTWGGGKVLDNTYAWTVIDAYLNDHDPTLGVGYRENQRNKAEYLAAAFAWLQERHPQTLIEARGLGGMWGFAVVARDAVCAAAWRRGLKLLTCGVTAEVSSIRALFLADVLAKEIDCFVRLLDGALADVEGSRATPQPTTH